MRLLALPVCLLAVAVSLTIPHAQSPAITIAGVIAGRVVDGGGAALPGVTIELLRSQRIERTTTSDARGEFRFEGLPGGGYDLRASMAGYVDVTFSVVAADKPLTGLNVVMAAQPPLRRELAQNPNAAPAERPGPPPPAAPLPVGKESAAIVGQSDMAAGRVRVGGNLQGFNTEAYDRIDENRFHRVTDEPLSTFSIDVDTASYSNVRRFLNDGTLPPADAVRIEELINYFRFSYPDAAGGAPFSVTTELAACPWNPKHRVALVGLQAPRVEQEKTPPRNLVFLLDVSGSMMPPDKLPMVKTAMRMLADTLRPEDRVAIVVYAGASGLALRSTPGSQKAEIQHAIAELRAGGSTNGAAGIQLAYDTAAAHFVKGGINRVILATDGDFNVGVTSQGELIRLIEAQRERGIFLSVLGVGTGNLKDSTMEKLADKGNGNYAYLDSLHEARRVLIAEAGATLVTIAKDVKIQIEFNPREVGAYRLVGYENRILHKQDFNDDRKDAGEMGSGHTVTALYELIPPDQPVPGPSVDPLKYQTPPSSASASKSSELMTVKLRYKEPDGDRSQLMSVAVNNRAGALTPNLGFASAVAQFGLLLRRSEFKGEATWSSARELAQRHRGADPDGYRAEFIRLVELAAALDAQGATSPQARQ